jgi:hypothetical protein
VLKRQSIKINTGEEQGYQDYIVYRVRGGAISGKNPHVIEKIINYSLETFYFFTNKKNMKDMVII